MSSQTRAALYYPYIEFSDPEWLWMSALLWDRIYRIIPDGFTPRDSDNVRALCRSGEIGIPLHPGPYAKEVAEEFYVKVKTGAWNAASLERIGRRGEAKMHQNKVEDQLRAMLIASGAARQEGEWLYVPPEFEATYMTYLAKKMALKNNLSALTDNSAAWTSLTFFQNPSIETEFAPSDSKFMLASLIVHDICPATISAISPEDLLKFREARRSERQRFLAAIEKLAEKIANCHDAKIVGDVIQDFRREVSESIVEYRRSMDLLKATGWIGWKTVTLPISANLFGALFAPDASKAVLAGTGVALGLIAGIADVSTKGRRLSKDHEFSYLAHLKDRFGMTSAPPNLVDRLRRELNEFVND